MNREGKVAMDQILNGPDTVWKRILMMVEAFRRFMSGSASYHANVTRWSKRVEVIKQRLKWGSVSDRFRSFTDFLILAYGYQYSITVAPTKEKRVELREAMEGLFPGVDFFAETVFGTDTAMLPFYLWERDHCRYYYFRDAKSRPLITVCIIMIEEEGPGPLYFRGISICGVGDQVSTMEGKDIALQRAVKAVRYYIVHRSAIPRRTGAWSWAISAIKSPRAFKVIESIRDHNGIAEVVMSSHYCKCMANIQPTVFERQLFFAPATEGAMAQGSASVEEPTVS